VLIPISGPLVFPQQRLAILNTAAARELLLSGGTIVAQSCRCETMAPLPKEIQQEN